MQEKYSYRIDIACFPQFDFGTSYFPRQEMFTLLTRDYQVKKVNSILFRNYAYSVRRVNLHDGEKHEPDSCQQNVLVSCLDVN